MSNHLESHNETSLLAAQQAFEHWRQNRTRRGSTPKKLRLLAASLIGEHRRSHICAALRINDQALKQWECEVSDAGNAQRMQSQRGQLIKTQGAFIELPAQEATPVMSRRTTRP